MEENLMGQDLFEYLPSEITTTILSRLPPRTVGASKCVCKPWLDLIETREFVKSYDLRKFAIIKGETSTNHFRIVESIDEHWDTVSEFSFPHTKSAYVSANGLLFMFDHDCKTTKSYDLFICNPITREYIKLPPSSVTRPGVGMLHISYGFGVSRVSGQYKLVRLFSSPKCEVYTLGTGQWRSVTPPVRESRSLGLQWKTLGVCCNGNLHWLSDRPESSLVKIMCFDLETELFSTFSFPNVRCGKSLSALGDRLYFRNHFVRHVDIWVMKKYGDEKSWTKESVIKKHRTCRDFYEHSSLKSTGLCCYSSNSISNLDTGDPEWRWYVYTRPTIYTPTFLSLKTFAPEENVTSF